jgi:F0F1-type ATP synthase membrane subunit b/b'
MTFSPTFFLAVNGLFDFDLTFPTQALLFLILSLVVTTTFLTPLGKQLDERSEFINYTIRKSTILLTFGYERLYTCVGFLTEEIDELVRQTKLIRNYTNEIFETEISNTQKENLQIVSKMKGDLAIKSAFLFSSLSKDINKITDKFFEKRFKSF